MPALTHPLTRLILRLYIVALFFGGCAPHKELRPTGPPPAPQVLVSKLQKEFLEVKNLRAWGKIKWIARDERRIAEHGVLIRRPDGLRLEGLSFLGTSLYTLVIHNGEISLYIPSEKVLYTGNASPTNMERLLSLPLKTDDALSILCGKPPLCTGDSTIAQDGEHYVLDISCQSASRRQRIRLDPIYWDPVTFDYFDPEGRLILSVRWDEYRTLEQVRVPTQVHIDIPLKGDSLDIRFKELDLNDSIPEERFQLDIPPTTEIRSL